MLEVGSQKSEVGETVQSTILQPKCLQPTTLPSIRFFKLIDGPACYIYLPCHLLPLFYKVRYGWLGQHHCIELEVAPTPTQVDSLVLALTLRFQKKGAMRSFLMIFLSVVHDYEKNQKSYGKYNKLPLIFRT